MNVPHKLITEQLLFKWGYIKTDKYFVNRNGLYLINKDGIWEFGIPNYHMIDKEHPFIKQGEFLYMDELNDYQLKEIGRGLECYNEQKRHDYYNKYGINYGTIWLRFKSWLERVRV